MNKQELAVLIPVLVVFFTGLVTLASTSIGKALARRIAGEAGEGRRLQARLDELDQEVAALREELALTHERLDFAERLITRHADQLRVGTGK